MDEKEILQRQIDALEKLLQIKEAIIQEQSARISKLEMDSIKINPYIGQPPYVGQPFTGVPFDPCPMDGGFHNYPNPWYGTVPPSCTKCGLTANNMITTFSSQNAATLP